MGLEAKCRAACGDQTGEGKLQLEGDSLLFRGDFRLMIARAEMKRVAAEGESLVVETASARARFELGAAAPKWVDKILHPPSLLDKLGVKAGSKVSLIGAFDAAFLAELRSRGDVGARPRKESDLVLLLASTPADLDGIPRAASFLAPAGGLWIVYPKGLKTITEMGVLRAGRAAGLKDNKVASFSATHTALRFVIPVADRRDVGR